MQNLPVAHTIAAAPVWKPAVILFRAEKLMPMRRKAG